MDNQKLCLKRKDSFARSSREYLSLTRRQWCWWSGSNDITPLLLCVAFLCTCHYMGYGVPRGVIRELQPEFKFPAKIETAFSQMLAIRSWSNEIQ